jgi:hypothetical protein
MAVNERGGWSHHVNEQVLASPHWFLHLLFLILREAISAGRHRVTPLSMKVSLHTAWALAEAPTST